MEASIGPLPQFREPAVTSAELKRAQTLETLGKVDETAQNMAMTNAQAVQEILQGQIVQPVANQ